LVSTFQMKQPLVLLLAINPHNVILKIFWSIVKLEVIQSDMKIIECLQRRQGTVFKARISSLSLEK
jgi:hypothetical protein